MWAGDETFLAGGYVDESLPLLERAYRLDPLSGINNGVLGIHYLASGQRELGRQHILRASELGWRAAEFTLLLDLVWTDEIEAAIALLRSFYPVDETTWNDYTREHLNIYAAAIRGEISSEELSARAKSGLLNGDTGEFLLAYTILGDYDPFLDRWLASHKYVDFFARQVFVPSGRAIAEHPKFFAVAKQRDLLPMWEAKGYPMGCDRVMDQTGEHLSCQDWPK